MTKTTLGIMGLLALAACHQPVAEAPALDFGTGEGISFRDDWGRPNGSQDPTDWTTDPVWNERELALFKQVPVSLNGPQQPGFIETCYACANPASTATWYIETVKPAVSSTYNLRMALVDAHGQRITGYQADHVSNGGYTWLLRYAQLGLEAGQRYRLYYVCYDEQNQLLCKGHGDVRYQL